MKTPKDKLDHLIKGGCKQVACFNDEGEPLVGFNQFPSAKTNPNALKSKVEQIVKFFKIAPSGEYVIVGRTAPRATPVEIPHKHMDGTPQPEIIELTETPTMSEPMESVLSYKEALRMATEIAELKSEVARLKAENAALNAELAEVEEALSAESEQNLADANYANTQNLVSQGMQMVVPLLDRWLAVQQEKNDMLRQQMQRPMYVPNQNGSHVSAEPSQESDYSF